MPGPRSGAARWTDQSGNLWLFGGSVFPKPNASFLNDLWEFNPATSEWTWVSGSNTLFAEGVYGTLGVAAPANVPGARSGSLSWTDQSGNLWLFGGIGLAGGGGIVGGLNDLWEFNPATSEWTWVGGSNSFVANDYACGTLGVPDPVGGSNGPCARAGSASWTDLNGNFWLFGGGGMGDSDLWKFSPTTMMWTNFSFKNVPLNGVYGTLGVPAPTNAPGARYDAVSWTDQSGNLWLFGGDPYYLNDDGFHRFNDLWRYDPIANEWTWEGGSNIVDAEGVYGTLGVAAPANVPGARSGSVSWTDQSGNFWLFGGENFSGVFNDLWSFNPATHEWTWMSGAQIGAAAGVYGKLGVATTGNVPGARYGSVSWTDQNGSFWLFGGFGFDSADAPGALGDLWRYQP